MAGLIPQQFIDDLIDRSDIVDIINQRVRLKKTGKNYSACCPFHDEKTPSFSVSPHKQFYHCFGCGVSGNAIGFLMEYDGMDFPSSIELLAQNAGLTVPREQLNPRAAAKLARKNNIYDELLFAAQYYQQQLLHSSQASKYLNNRELSSEVVSLYALGYVPEGWDNLLKQAPANSEKNKLLNEGGMFVENEDKSRMYDRFRHRIMFPIRDQRGRTVAFGGRVLGDDKPKYINSPETSVFHKSRELYGLYEAMKQRGTLDQLIVVEGYMDVVALAQFGIKNAVATMGTSVGKEHLERIFRHVSHVVFCFDGDAAGRKAAGRALDECLELMLDGRHASFLFLPDGEDPDSFVRQKGMKPFIRQVDQAQPLSEFIFALSQEGLNMQIAEHKSNFVQKAVSFVQQLPKGLLQGMLFEEIAKISGVSLQAIEKIALKASTAQKQAKQIVEARKKAAEIIGFDSTITPQQPNGFEPSDESNHSEQGNDQDEEDKKALTEQPVQQSKQALVIKQHFARLLELILQQPALSLSKNLECEQIQNLDPEQLIPVIKSYTKKSPNTSFIALHGYWTGYAHKLAKKLGAVYAKSRFKNLDPEQLKTEFDETLEHIILCSKREQIETEIRKLGHKFSDDQLSPSAEDKAKLKQLYLDLKRVNLKPKT